MRMLLIQTSLGKGLGRGRLLLCRASILQSSRLAVISMNDHTIQGDG